MRIKHIVSILIQEQSVELAILVSLPKSAGNFISSANVVFSIGVKPNIFNVIIDSDFSTNKGKISVRNWNPRFFLKKDAAKLNIELQ